MDKSKSPKLCYNVQSPLETILEMDLIFSKIIFFVVVVVVNFHLREALTPKNINVRVNLAS